MQKIVHASPEDTRNRGWVRKAAALALLPGFALGLSFGCSKVDNSTAAGPAITLFSPTTADGSSGTLVTVTGTGFTGATGVSVCGVAVPSGSSFPNNNVISDTMLTFNLPPVTASGPVTVTGPSGTGTSDPVFFIVAPRITTLLPASGTTGTPVTITGNGLLGVTSVTFDGVAGTNLALVSAAQLTVDAPAVGVTGPVTVDVNVAGATSAASSFTYNNPIP